MRSAPRLTTQAPMIYNITRPQNKSNTGALDASPAEMQGNMASPGPLNLIRVMPA